MEHNDSLAETNSGVTQEGVSTRMWISTIAAIVFLPALVLFGSAGTFQWGMAWLYILLSSTAFAVSRLIVWRINPDLLRERGRILDHSDTAAFDRILVPLLVMVGPILIGLTAGFAVRFDWQPVFPSWAQWLGAALYVVGAVFGSWAMVVNPFFSGVVRIQKERGHHVITAGPYAILRHPGYLASIIGYLGMVLMLGSPWAVIPLIFEIVVLVVRTSLEDQTLQEELPGYREYSRHTRYRLVPGVW